MAKDAIEITAAGVNLDLNGFLLVGLGPKVAIRVLADYASVRNGTIGSGGITTTFDSLSCERLLFVQCSLNAGNKSRVEKCAFHISSNLIAGSGCTVSQRNLSTSSRISLSAQARVDGCTVVNASGTAVQTGPSAVITRTLAQASTGAGFVTGTGGTLTDCMAIGNGGDGFNAGIATSMKGCIANGNQGSFGIRADFGSTLSHCSAEANATAFGISVASRSVISDCTAVANTSSAATSGGIQAGGEATIVNCTASSNASTNATLTGSTGGGILAGNSSTVKDCTVTGNTGDGIQVTNDSRVANNNCDSNGAGDGAGIHVTGSDNRIEGNNVTDNDRGIDVDSSGNLIIKNSASGNVPSNYDIAASDVGFYISGTTTAAVVGSSGGTTVGTTDSWANISY